MSECSPIGVWTPQDIQGTTERPSLNAEANRIGFGERAAIMSGPYRGPETVAPLTADEPFKYVVEGKISSGSYVQDHPAHTVTITAKDDGTLSATNHPAEPSIPLVTGNVNFGPVDYAYRGPLLDPSLTHVLMDGDTILAQGYVPLTVGRIGFGPDLIDYKPGHDPELDARLFSDTVPHPIPQLVTEPTLLDIMQGILAELKTQNRLLARQLRKR